MYDDDLTPYAHTLRHMAARYDELGDHEAARDVWEELQHGPSLDDEASAVIAVTPAPELNEVAQ